ncbi:MULTISPECIES: MBL fold metallo-hydrolase [unclassified Pseudomonas]|uniref:MBL fold metallo-hydrolase n=1 Tax=unclassified Pseudomonas TaxID=196821 RepID=UPI00088D6816|nr:MULTISPECIES: MBL fold metallo-hydrolase [unclassified Pseudomonas]SCY83776.1 Glyoxylase, beta-lactamase superfamily II [Pseudomonas sp. NFACC37-1]SFO81900.1 Glyoxylase, beta-lactamase superfamily II [Pseudomonas sp. NFACC24-1]
MAAQKFRCWQVGDVLITRIVETAPVVSPVSLMFPEDDDALIAPHLDWLKPHFLDSDGQMLVAWQCFIIETPDRRIMVDTCIGNDRKRYFDIFNDMHNPFLEDLRSAGYPPESIDTVLCTHLHYDHVGWNTRLVNGKWIPTFPNARYLFGQVEWEYMLGLAESGDWHHAGHVPDCLLPIMEFGLADLIDTDFEVCAQVRLLPTPGHTPGHVSVHIESQGQVAVITGDIMHHPVQMAIPDKHCAFDHDKAQACCTRRTFLARYQDSDALVIGSHFPEPTAGHVLSDQSAWRFEGKVNDIKITERGGLNLTKATNANEQLVIDFFTTLSTGDLVKLGAFIDADTTWTPMIENVPGAGTHTGKAICEAFLAPVRGLFTDGDPKVLVDSVVSSGDKVMCETRGVGKLRDGRPYNNRYAWAFVICDGRIKVIREYMDSHYVMVNLMDGQS